MYYERPMFTYTQARHVGEDVKMAKLVSVYDGSEELDNHFQATCSRTELVLFN